MKIFGHRGAAGLAADNSMAAIKAGLLSGADGIEVDLHYRQGKLFIGHDRDDQNGANLDDTLKLVLNHNPTTQLYLDGKTGRWAAALANKLSTLPKDKRSLISVGSFYYLELHRFKKLCPDIRIFYSHKFTPGIHLLLAKQLGAYGVCYNYYIYRGTSDWMRRRLGLKMAYYTVNDPSVARRCQRKRADYIFSDRPDLIIRDLRS